MFKTINKRISDLLKIDLKKLDEDIVILITVFIYILVITVYKPALVIHFMLLPINRILFIGLVLYFINNNDIKKACLLSAAFIITVTQENKFHSCSSCDKDNKIQIRESFKNKKKVEEEEEEEELLKLNIQVSRI